MILDLQQAVWIGGKKSAFV